MPANVNSLAPVVVTPVGGAPTVLALESMGFSADILQNIHHHTGNMSPTLVAGAGANPRVMLSVPFAMAFAVFGFGVVQLTQCDIYFSTFLSYVRAAGTNAVHTKLGLSGSPSGNSVAAAQIVGLSVSVDGILMANVEILPIAADYQVHPFVQTNNVTLPVLTGSPLLHTLGPVSVEGVIIPGLAGHSLQIQGNLTGQRNDGDLYPRVAHRTQIAPQLTLSHQDPIAVLTSLGLIGRTISVGVVAYFKAYDPTSGLVSATGGISVSVALGRLTHAGADSTQGQVSSTTLTVTPITTDGNAIPFVIATGVAIPEVP